MTTAEGRLKGNQSRQTCNRADLVWQLWYGYSPEDAAARVGISSRTLQRHINALLESTPDPDDWITAEVIGRLRHRADHPGERWENTVPVSRPRNGREFHDYARNAPPWTGETPP